MFLTLPEDDQTVSIYRDFLPHRVFDAHVHLHGAGTIPHVYNPTGVFCRESVTAEDYLTDMSPFFPNVREFRLHAMPMPDPLMNDPANGMRQKANAHIVQELQKNPSHVGACYVLQGDGEREIEQMADLEGIRAIKCYWFAAGKQNGEDCDIQDYLPVAAWEVAERRRLPIFLHMMRPHALSDEKNFSYIVQMARRYPNAKLVLAHCARAFASWTGVKKICQLHNCENIWFDTAAICEPSPMMACIKYAPDRTVWGSDYPICMNRGKVISLGSGFYWLTGKNAPRDASSALIAENLLALYQACLLLDTDQSLVERLFYGNAVKLFGLT